MMHALVRSKFLLVGFSRLLFAPGFSRGSATLARAKRALARLLDPAPARVGRPSWPPESRAGRACQHRRAVTLAELLISIAGLVLIGGMALGVYEATQSAAGKMTRRQGTIDYSVRAMDEIASAIADAVAPENFETAPAPAEFKKTSLAFLSYHGRKAPGLCLLALAGKDGKLSRLEKATTAPGGAADQAKELDASPAGKFDNVPISISFRYAKEAHLGKPIAYVDELAPGEWPALVEVKVRAEFMDDPERPIELKTAVIPGRIHSGN